MFSLGGQVAEPCLDLLASSFHSFIFLSSKYNHSSYSVRDHIFCKAILPPAETRPSYGGHSIGMYLAVVAGNTGSILHAGDRVESLRTEESRNTHLDLHNL